MPKYPIVIKKGNKIPMEIAKEIFFDVDSDLQKLDIETRGVWSIPTKCKGLAVRRNFDNGDLTIFGYRTMTNVRQSGYELEGWVSIQGVKRSCFTSSCLFELENEHLINVGIIFPRIKME